MRLSTTLIRLLSITLLLIGSLFLAAACSEEPTPAPTATPVPTPTPSVDDFLAAVGASITGMETAKFGLIDETETGALFLGMTFKSMEAELETPSSVRMVVSVGASGFGFVEIEIIEVEEQAFLKLSEGAPWAHCPRTRCLSILRDWVWFLPLCKIQSRTRPWQVGRPWRATRPFA